MPKTTGSKFIADTVHGYGINHVFFMPYIAPRALMEMEKLGIRRVQTHGEKAAAYMADGYARVTGRPGVCEGPSGGGATYILPGVVDIPQGAWWEPDEQGVDRRGNINVLTSERWTAWAKGNAQHTIMVEVEKV